MQKSGNSLKVPAHKFYSLAKDLLPVSCLGSFIDKTQYKITKIIKASTITMGAKWEEIQKVTKKAGR